MIHKFTFDADLVDVPGVPNVAFQTRLGVEILVHCRDMEGCDATFEIETLILPNGELLTESQLSETDQSRLEGLCQDIADEAGPEAAREAMIDFADHMRDVERDRD